MYTDRRLTKCGRSRLGGAHLVLVGDGPLLQPLQKLAEELGITARTHLVGYQANPEN